MRLIDWINENFEKNSTATIAINQNYFKLKELIDALEGHDKIIEQIENSTFVKNIIGQLDTVQMRMSQSNLPPAEKAYVQQRYLQLNMKAKDIIHSLEVNDEE